MRKGKYGIVTSVWKALRESVMKRSDVRICQYRGCHMTRGNMWRRILRKLSLHAPKFEDPRTWKALLVAAVAVPAIATLFFWYQTGFERPMPKWVFDRVASDPLIFSASVGLVVASFFIQYYTLPPVRRKQEMMRKTPLLIFMGMAVAAVASALLWWQEPTIRVRTIISEITHKPFILGSILGLTLSGIGLIFLLSSKEKQRRCFKAVLTLSAAFLVFGGPTYLMFMLEKLKVPYPLLVLVGLSSFTAGVILFTRLIKEEERET